jgi:hypothetical protein
MYHGELLYDSLFAFSKPGKLDIRHPAPGTLEEKGHLLVSSRIRI